MADLSGKVAIVTGAARGIGAAVARHLAADGARVIVNYSHSERPANEVVEIIKSDGGEAKTVRADMSDPASIKHLFDQTIETFGRLDILVNNAGVAALKPLEECSDEDFNDMFNLNVLAVFLAAREAAKLMEEGGRIVNIGSIHGDRMPFPGGSLYGGKQGHSRRSYARLGARSRPARDNRQLCAARANRHRHEPGQQRVRARDEVDDRPEPGRPTRGGCGAGRFPRQPHGRQYHRRLY